MEPSMPEVNPPQMAQVGGQMTGLADDVHSTVNAFEPPTGPAGFACTAASVQLWTGFRPALLASGALVAQFGDDLTGSGADWSAADVAGAQHFQPPGGR